MSIREYKEKEHKAGFIGLRVTVSVGGDYRQKYFNFKKVKTEEEKEKLKKEAEQINSTWNMERRLIQSQKELDCKEKRRTSSAFTASVSGVKMKFTRSHKSKKGQPKSKRKYYYIPVFIISGSTNGVRFDKAINISRFGYDMAWFKAISYYAEMKGISNYSHLLERKPPVEQFYVIYKYQQSLGHDIPPRRLPKELDPELLAA